MTGKRLAPSLRWPLDSVAGLHAGDFERNDFVAEKRHDPADRADEARAALCRSSTSSSGTAFSGSVAAALRPGYRAWHGLRFCGRSCIFRLCRQLGFRVVRDRRLVFLRTRDGCAQGRFWPGPRLVLRVGLRARIKPSTRTTRRRGVASVRISASPRLSCQILRRRCQILQGSGIIQSGISSAADFEKEVHADASMRRTRGRPALPADRPRLRPRLPPAYARGRSHLRAPSR